MFTGELLPAHRADLICGKRLVTGLIVAGLGAIQLRGKVGGRIALPSAESPVILGALFGQELEGI